MLMQGTVLRGKEGDNSASKRMIVNSHEEVERGNPQCRPGPGKAVKRGTPRSRSAIFPFVL
jgi:hypothetical protein